VPPFRKRQTPTKTGWQPVRASDLRATGAEPGCCERCGRRDLRFLHVVAHPDEGQLHVGSECARHLCYGYAPDREEARLQNLWERQSRWLTRRWGVTWKGNETLTFAHEGETVRVTVFETRPGAWKICIAVAGSPLYSPRPFPTADAAKVGAFDALAESLGW
jgi:hypothetical protein